MNARQAPSVTRDARALSELELRAWRGLLAAHATIARELDAMLAEHRLGLTSYEVLFELAQAEGRRLRMSQLAENVGLTRSGLTRMIDSLERDGLVRRTRCGEDQRGCFAELTDPGLRKVREAAATHADAVRTLFCRRFDPRELDALASLLQRLPHAAVRRTA